MSLRRNLLVLGAVAVIALALGFTLPNPFLLDLLFTAILFASLGQAWNWISGYGGQISFGHAMFFGCGAYASALVARAQWSPWAGPPLGAAAAAVLALAVGYPCFRLRGHYFSIATIAVAAIVEVLAKNWDAIGSANGIELPIAPSSFATLQFASKGPYIVLAVGLFVIAQVMTMRLEGSRMGYYLRALRANHDASASVGINERTWKLGAFAASAIVTALGGSLYAQYTLFVDPDSVFSLAVSISIALVGVVGGAGSLWGPGLGALVYVFVARYIGARVGGSGNGLDLILYGGLICAIAALEPAGISGLIRRYARRRARAAAEARA